MLEAPRTWVESRHKRKSDRPSLLGRALCFGMARRRDYIGSSDRVWSQREPSGEESSTKPWGAALKIRPIALPTTSFL